MNIASNIKICFFVFLLVFINIPLGHSNRIYTPPLSKHVGNAPPVEKVKPPAEKKKKKKKKRVRRSSIKKHLSKKKDRKKIKSESNFIEMFFAVFGLLIAMLIIVGAFIFGFGIQITAAWITGIVLMGIANFFDALIMIGFSINGFDSSYAETFFWGIFLFDFVIGLTFLIWGALVAGPVAWIMGIILLGLALLFLAIFIFSRL